MTPDQEKKLDAVFEATIRVEGKFDLVNEKIATQRKITLEHEKEIQAVKSESNTRISSLEGDRDKVKGAMWFSGIVGGGGIITFLYNIFTHK